MHRVRPPQHPNMKNLGEVLIRPWSNMPKNSLMSLLAALVVIVGLSSFSSTQSGPAQQTPPADQKQDQNIPDAPSAVQPPKPAPEPEAAPPEAAPQDQAQPSPETTEPPAQEAPPESSPNPTEKPPINIQTVPEGHATKENQGAREQLFTLTTRVDQVLVPVTVKDDSGRLVNGLLAKDFDVLENGKKKKL